MGIEINGYSSTHHLHLKKCEWCGKKFIKYSKANRFCSDECVKNYHRVYDAERWQKIKTSPTLRYNHRKGVIEQREQERKEKIRQDLPNIKAAAKKGDDFLVDYLFDHYAFNGGTRKYRKPQEDL